MGMVTAGTDYPANAKRGLAFRSFQRTSIVPMNGQASGMSTGTGEPMELKVNNKIIIKIWC